MPPIQSILTCYDLQSCFQAVYNLGLVLLFVLAFLNMVYGAILYLFSAANIFNKEEGKNRIVNSIGAIAITLILPQILNIINPGIFQVKLWIPTIERASSPLFNREALWGEAESVNQVNSVIPTQAYYWLEPTKAGKLADYTCFTNNPVYISSNDPLFGSITTYNEKPVSSLVYKQLTECVSNKYSNFRITQGYNPGSFDKSHQLGYGIDIVPNDGNYQALTNALVSCGFSVLNESERIIECYGEGSTKIIPPCPLECRGTYLKPGCVCAYTRPHLHAALMVKELK